MSYAFSKTLNFQYACYRNCISYILMYYTLIYIFNCIRDKYRKGVKVLVWKEFGIVKTGTVSLWDWVGGKKTPSVLGHLCNKSSQVKVKIQPKDVLQMLRYEPFWFLFGLHITWNANALNYCIGLKRKLCNFYLKSFCFLPLCEHHN